MIPQALIAGFQQVAALALGTGAIACLPAIANSGGESDAIATTVFKSTNEPPQPPPANNPPAAPGFSLPEFSFEFPSPIDVSRAIVKSSLVLLLDIADQTQGFFSEIGESFQDLVNEAKLEQQEMAKTRSEGGAPAVPVPAQPMNVTIEDGDSSASSAEASPHANER